MPTLTALLTLTTIFPLPTDIICTFCAQFINEDDREQKLFTEICHALWHVYGNLLDIEVHLFPLGFHIPFLSLLFVILTLAVPFIGYHYVKMYRDKICGGSIQFSHAVSLYHIHVYVCFPAGSRCTLRLFPVH